MEWLRPEIEDEFNRVENSIKKYKKDKLKLKEERE